MENVTKVLKNVDFEMLKTQKITLVTVINELESPEQKEALEGILDMIDNIQNAVVADGIKTEAEVFYSNWFKNYYRCPTCKTEWDSEWDSMCDEDCPVCEERAITPHYSEQIKGD